MWIPICIDFGWLDLDPDPEGQKKTYSQKWKK
jgi:hypothetical protein